eukprot:Gregarina_sp_Poly_1__6878@NODE_3728_length_909_cov_6_838480_g2391_i0_p1_GENE_NODE_3728_length_909_cov_6_838480_g2391_i0NODE_3728_length_909_cov_6_838480_g2391_i0_p1_ORF_typecomplete_len126_score20_52_NODE_3728_length_909_cov_6_838480_g2391_i0191568
MQGKVLPQLTPWGHHHFYRKTRRSMRAFVSDEFLPIQNETIPSAVLALLQIGFESISTKISELSMLQLVLLPEDSTNFPWKSIETKLASLKVDIRMVDQWNVLLGAGTTTVNTGWFKLPLAMEKT